jgi:hypothetical protein
MISPLSEATTDPKHLNLKKLSPVPSNFPDLKRIALWFREHIYSFHQDKCPFGPS